MAIAAELKMQIEAIKNPGKICVIDYGDTVLLTDGWRGPYIKKEKAVINLEKIRNAGKPNDDLDPGSIDFVSITKTNHLLVTKDGRIVRRFDTKEKEHLWARNDWLSDYGNAFSYATDKTRKAIIPIGINGEPMGIVLCMHIDKSYE